MTRLVYVDKDFNYSSSITKLKALGIGAASFNDPSVNGASRLFVQNVVQNTISTGSYYSIKNYMYVKPTVDQSNSSHICDYNLILTTGGTGKKANALFAAYNYCLNNSNVVSNNLYGTYSRASLTGVGSSNTGNIFGTYSYATSDKTAATIYGSYSLGYALAGGTVDRVYGTRASAYNYSGSGTIASAMYGVFSTVRTDNASTTTSGYAIYASSSIANSGSFTNIYNIYSALPALTNDPSSRYHIYCSGNAKSYFGGAVTIAATDPLTHKLRVNGTAGKNTGSTWAIISDARLKNVTGDYKKGLDEICKLNTVTYKYKQDNDLSFDLKERSGLIAQEVEKVLPSAVNNDSQWKQLDIDPIIYALINSVKELKNKIEDLENVNKRN